jgi:hypothetical protein
MVKARMRTEIEPVLLCPFHSVMANPAVYKNMIMVAIIITNVTLISNLLQFWYITLSTKLSEFYIN